MLKALAETLKALSSEISTETIENVFRTDSAETATITLPALITDFDVKSQTTQTAFPRNGVYQCTASWTLAVSAHDVSREDFLAAADAIEQTSREIFTPKNEDTQNQFKAHGLVLLSASELTRTEFTPGTDSTAETLTATIEREFTFAG